MPSDRLRWRQVRRTTPFRLTLLLGALFLAALWATLGTSWLFTTRALTERTDHILRARAAALLAAPAALLPSRVDAEVAAGPRGISYYALVGADGQRVTGNIRLGMPAPPGRPFSIAARSGAHGPMRALAMRTAHGETVVVGRDVSQIVDLRRRLLRVLLLSGVAGTVLVLAAAVLLSLPPLRRVRDLSRAARAVAAGDLARRLPIAGRHDELDQLAITVNAMIDEVGHVIAQVKAATDAIAHDLRTPLTRVRATLARVRGAPDLPPDAAAAIGRAMGDLDAVTDRFAALLRLSELEAGGRRTGLGPVELAPLLAELAELWQPLAEERGVVLRIEVGPAPPIDADRELLAEAIGNLLDNAIKFARTDVIVRVVNGDRPAIEVIDDGPGVPADEKEAVLRRFHRAAGAAGVEGTGLGLAVVSAILRLHGFTLEVADADPGLIARVYLTEM